MTRPILSIILTILTAVGVIGAIAYLSICVVLILYQNRLIFVPSSTIETTPADLNLPHEDIWIKVDNPSKSSVIHQIHGWWIPAKASEVGVVLHLHGNGHNVGANVSQALQFHELGLSVLMIDYRGYGRSQGHFPTEASVYQDARIAWNYLTQNREISPEKILLFGHSLGGAIAIDLALDHPEAAGLIVQSSFTSMRDMVDRMSHFSIFPIDLILNQRFNSIAKVRSLQMPTLYIHGTADSIIPADMSETLYAATSDPRSLILIPGADHNNVPEVGGKTYLQALKNFVTQAYGQTSRPNTARSEF